MEMQKVMELVIAKIKHELNTINSSSNYDQDEKAIKRAKELVDLYYTIKKEG